MNIYKVQINIEIEAWDEDEAAIKAMDYLEIELIGGHCRTHNLNYEENCPQCEREDSMIDEARDSA